MPLDPLFWTQHPSDQPLVLTERPLAPKRPPLWAMGGAGLLALAVGCGAGIFFSRGRASAPAIAKTAPSASAPAARVLAPASAALAASPAARPATALAAVLTPSAPPPVVGPAALAPPSAAPPVAAAAPEPPVLFARTDSQATRATLTVPRSRSGHRVWVDGHLVGQSPGTFSVPCGTHAVRVGSHGALQRIDVACGADRIVR